MSVGNWGRAFVALRHLLQNLGSSNNSAAGYIHTTHRSMISPIPLSNYLEGLKLPSSSEKLFQWSSSLVETGSSPFVSTEGRDAQNTVFSSRSEFTDFTEAVQRLHDSTYITKVEKMQTLALIDLLQEISNPHSISAYGSLDEPGRRYFSILVNLDFGPLL